MTELVMSADEVRVGDEVEKTIDGVTAFREVIEVRVMQNRFRGMDSPLADEPDAIAFRYPDGLGSVHVNGEGVIVRRREDIQ